METFNVLIQAYQHLRIHRHAVLYNNEISDSKQCMR